MRPIFIDTETHVFTATEPVPKLVCVSIAFEDSERESVLLDATDGAREFRKHLNDPNRIIVGANIAYDLRVLRRYFLDLGDTTITQEIFDAYLSNRISDIQLREQLFAIANGTLGSYPDGRPLPHKMERYSLAILTEIHCPHIKPKEHDEYRLRYGEFDGIPIAQWPFTARQYPIDDVETTREVYYSQDARAMQHNHQGNLHDDHFQAFVAWCADLGANRGWSLNPNRVAVLRQQYEAKKANPAALRAERLVDRDGSVNRKVVKRKLATHHGCTLPCGRCGGKGFTVTQNPKKNGKGFKKPEIKTCKLCDSTGLYLEASLTLPRTDGGKTGVRGIAIGRDALSETDDPELAELVDYTAGDKILNTYLPNMEAAIVAGGRLLARANVLLATGRVSYQGIFQVFPKKAGARECIEATDGFVIISIDYAGIEMVGWAYVCKQLLGYSKLADVLNADADAHSLVGAQIVNVSEAEFLKEKKGKFKAIRDASKALNFGLPGGMGVPTFVLQKRKDDYVTKSADGTEYDGIRFCIMTAGALKCGVEKVTEWKGRTIEPTCRACLECATELKKSWEATWPEAKPYLKLIGEMAGKSDSAQMLTGMWRGGMTYTSMANSFFQSIVALGAKKALCAITYECYCDPDSPLYGSYPIVFAHDEVLAELPIDRFRAAAKRMEEIMVAEMESVIPGILVKAEPAIMKNWSKRAEAVYNEKGELEIWNPKN